MKQRIYWTLLPLLVFFALFLFLWRGMALDPRHLPTTKAGKPLPSFQVPLLVPATDPKLTSLSPKLMIGKPFLLNFWASWCSSCSGEQAFLVRLAKQGIPIYGLNLKDNKKEAKAWLKTYGNPYQLVGEDREGRVAIDMGVYGTPETFLIDSKGMIIYRHAGILNGKIWQREFLPRLKALQGK